MQLQLSVTWRDVLALRCYINLTKQLHLHWPNNISTDSFLNQIRDSPADLLSVHSLPAVDICSGSRNLQGSWGSYSLLIHIMHIFFSHLHCEIYRLIWLPSFHTNTHLVHSVLLHFLRNAVQRCTVCHAHKMCLFGKIGVKFMPARPYKLILSEHFFNICICSKNV